MRAEELAAQFGIAGILDFKETADGLAKAMISLDGMVGELYLQGAQLTAWQLSNERPVLFTSPRSAFAPGRAIRGGIPILRADPVVAPRRAKPRDASDPLRGRAPHLLRGFRYHRHRNFRARRRHLYRQDRSG